jgi:cell division protein FtsQ
VRARSDAVPVSVRRFNQRARPRRMRAAAPWAVAATVLLVVGLVAWLVYGTSVLGVRRVQVDGTAVLDPRQVEEAAAVQPGTPLARVDLDAVRARVAKLAPVARATVDRLWPGTLLVVVTERTAVAAVPVSGTFALVDGSGVAFHTVPARPAGLPVVRLARPGPDDPTTTAALSVLAALTPTLRERLTEIVAELPTRIRLSLRDKKTIIWGDATENDTKAKVATALLGQPGTEIDVSAPEVVTVR